MANATDTQVQTYVNNRVRPHCELLRQLVLAFSDDISAIDDVYSAVSAGSPTWADNRADGPPHLLTPSDVLAYNALMHAVRDFILAQGEYAIALKACVRSPV